MKQNKAYPYELEEKGFKERPFEEMTECQLAKRSFVESHLSRAVKYADSGWEGVEYVVYSNGEEFVFLLDSDYGKSCGICVTANSKVAIATAVFDNIY